jgi:hypothetical protein
MEAVYGCLREKDKKLYEDRVRYQGHWFVFTESPGQRVSLSYLLRGRWENPIPVSMNIILRRAIDMYYALYSLTKNPESLKCRTP